MPNSKILRVENFVVINDIQSPYYGETGPISDYDKVTGMATVDINFAGKNFQWKYDPSFLTLTGNPPIYTAVHQFDQVVVVNIMSPMYGATGQVVGLIPRVNGMEVEIKETHSGVLFHFWSDELSPTQSISLGSASPSGVISTQQPTQAVAPKFIKGDWVEVVSQRSRFNGLIGQVLDVLASGNLMLDFGGPAAVEMLPQHCKMYHPVINKTAQPLAHP